MFLIPNQYVSTVLQLAHTWGRRKPVSRLGINPTGPESSAPLRTTAVPARKCQITALRAYYRNPFVPLPIIEVPFERVAMDLVGPLVKSTRGHKYILVIVDYTTRYPEAIPFLFIYLFNLYSTR